MSRRLGFGLILFLLAAVGACSSGKTQDEGRPLANAGGTAGTSADQPSIQFTAPAGWVKETPSSSMRKGQYRLPHAEGDAEDAELTVFNFGPGQGGSVDSNIDRWVGQFANSDGSPIDKEGKVNEKIVNGKTVTIVDVSGTFITSMGPMMASGPPKPNYRMLAAIIDSSQGPWFFKLTGPEKTIEKWESSFDEFTETLRVQ